MCLAYIEPPVNGSSYYHLDPVELIRVSGVLVRLGSYNKLP